MAETTVSEVGQYLKSVATHHDHGDGWEYSRDIGDLELIRYRSDYTGYHHWWKRVKRAFDWKHLTGRDSFSRMLRRERRFRFLSAVAWIKVSLQKDRHLPDGKVGPVLTHWEEDGEYIEAVGPTIGALVADFLIEESSHPHAVKIAAEIHRIVWRDQATEEADHG